MKTQNHEGGPAFIDNKTYYKAIIFKEYFLDLRIEK